MELQQRLEASAASSSPIATDATGPQGSCQLYDLVVSTKIPCTVKPQATGLEVELSSSITTGYLVVDEPRSKSSETAGMTSCAKRVMEFSVCS